MIDIQTALSEAVQFVKSGGDRFKLEGYLTLTDSLVGILKMHYIEKHNVMNSQFHLPTTVR